MRTATDKTKVLTFDRLAVQYDGQEVGTLARTSDGLYPFEYASSWLATGFALNPLTLPLRKGVFMPKLDPLDGMFGVFEDSLPDGWGRLLVDRMLKSKQMLPHGVNKLARLAIVGSSGMGALNYVPTWELDASAHSNSSKNNLDQLAKDCASLLKNEDTDDLDEIFLLGGSSGGARPKILTKVEGEDWIIKFPSTYDPPNIGKQEYLYALCAQTCGVEFPEVRLFPSNLCSGYFGARRFDRGGTSNKLHMVSVAGLLETTHRTPNLDYHDLMKLTFILTKDYEELKRLYRLMCFNVFAHNRDDHSKNFSFLYNHETRTWTLSPAYDLTYSSSINGEHATTVAGNGKNPGMDDVLAIASMHDLSKTWARKTAETIKEEVQPLMKYHRVAR